MPGIRRLARRLLGRSKPRREGPPSPIPPPLVMEGLESSPESLMERQKGGESMLFVDVRAPEERDKMIPGAIAMSVRQMQVDWPDLDGEKTVVCYCATGGQSVNAAELLRERGLEGPTCILGGLPAWEDAGGPVETAEA